MRGKHFIIRKINYTTWYSSIVVQEDGENDKMRLIPGTLRHHNMKGIVMLIISFAERQSVASYLFQLECVCVHL